jgi:cytoskeletal protein CcmA (bactofilin family)
MSVLGPTTRVAGHVRGRGALDLGGRVEGNVDVTGACTIADGAEVIGDVSAESLEVAGALVGDASVAAGVVVRSTATVRGACRAARIVIEPGAQVSLRLDAEFDLDLSPNRRSR